MDESLYKLPPPNLEKACKDPDYLLQRVRIVEKPLYARPDVWLVAGNRLRSHDS